MEKLISIIVPVYNVEKYLRVCVNSIIKQTYKNLEIILVDDGSNDACAAICDEYAEKDERVKVIHKKNGGADSARKAGILVASGEYVGYVDGDDWIEPDMYKKLLYLAEKNDVDIVESGVIDSIDSVFEIRKPFFEEGCYKGEEFDKKIAPYGIYSGHFFRFGIQCYLVTKLFKREKFVQFQMLEDFSDNITDDVLCTFPAVFYMRSIYITHDCFYHYRIRNDSAKHTLRTDIPQKVKKIYKNDELRFIGSKPGDFINIQMSYFYMYLLMAKSMYVFDDVGSDNYLTPYGKISKKDKIIIYGAGVVGINIHDYVKSVGGNIVYWVDRNYNSLKSELEVSAPQDIINIDFDYVIIAIFSEGAVKSAKEWLKKEGVPEDKILWVEQKYIDNPRELLKCAKYNGEYIFSRLKA